MRNRTPSCTQKTLCSQGCVHLVGRGRKPCIQPGGHSQAMRPRKMKLLSYRRPGEVGSQRSFQTLSSAPEPWSPGFVRGGVSWPRTHQKTGDPPCVGSIELRGLGAPAARQGCCGGI